MRTLYESLLDINDVEASVEPITMIDNWCKDNISGNYKIDEKTLAINSSSTITITDENLVELPSYIHFGVVKRNFYCVQCIELKSLVGFPKEVGGDFYCGYCDSLKSLEGAPKEVGGGFVCDNCTSLTSLKGAPKKIAGSFWCENCPSLKSLDGIPAHLKDKIHADI